MTGEVKYQYVEEIVSRGSDQIDEIYQFSSHLVYSSPATLAYNSPGAEGFGIKRAGLSIPGSIMLIVAPGCCGRNTKLIADMPSYDRRFFYLMMDETDLVTGRHLTKIPEAVKEIVASLTYKPSVVMICITCVDALLGTDMERVCKKAEDYADVKVRPCYMYALTREGRKPPMVHVRQSLYSMLEARPKVPTAMNILGFFAPLKDTELLELFYRQGMKTIRQISTCDTYEAFLDMAEANFNLVLHPEAVPAAKDLYQRFKTPMIELNRFYGIERIHRQYQALSKLLKKDLDDLDLYHQALEKAAAFKRTHPDLDFVIGECINANPFELALSLVEYGFHVKEIYANVEASQFVYLKPLSVLSPKTKVYSNMEPTMMHYAIGEAADVALGKDAAFYHPEAVSISWNQDEQPFGYRGLMAFIDTIEEAL